MLYEEVFNGSIEVQEYETSIDSSLILKLGTTYQIVFNGSTYYCEAKLLYNNNPYDLFLGNRHILDEYFEDNGYPFCINQDTLRNSNFYFWAIEEGNYNVVIFEQKATIHKIDEKYLPNIIGESTTGKVCGVYNKELDKTEEVIALYGAEIFNDYYDNVATGYFSHAEGHYTTASGDYSHAECYTTTASGKSSHAEGDFTTASGRSSHAEGISTTASGESSHAEGIGTTASGRSSHAEGYYTIASCESSHVEGKYNIEDTEEKYAHIVGNGEYDALSNAHTLDWEGNAWFAGDVYVGGTSQNDVNSNKVLTEKEITSPKDYFALTDIDNGYTYIVQMKNGNLVSRCGVSSIEVTAMPDKIEYYAGEYFDDSTGMVVTATCEDGSVIEITNYTCSDNQFVIGANTVTISYNEAGNTYTTTIIVNAIEFDAATVLVDFNYTDNGDGTYTITAWKGTKNGVASTEMVVPDSSKIIL